MAQSDYFVCPYCGREITDDEFVHKKVELMPYKIEKKSGERPYKIINKETGKVVGSSTSRSDAEASVRARWAGHKK